VGKPCELILWAPTELACLLNVIIGASTTGISIIVAKWNVIVCANIISIIGFLSERIWTS
jgi:hypothetical protein